MTQEGNIGFSKRSFKIPYVQAIESRINQDSLKKSQSHKLIAVNPPTNKELAQMNQNDPKKINYLGLFHKLRDHESDATYSKKSIQQYLKSKRNRGLSDE